jgi:hypothetical protein
MFHVPRIGLKLGLLVTLLVMVTVSLAKPKQVGPLAATASMTVTSLALGGGMEWGEGILTLADGTQHRFMVKGLLVGTVGVGKAFVHGRIYHLSTLADFAGRYLAVEAEMTVMEGAGGTAMRNQHGVVMYLSSVEQGVEVTLGAEVVEIKLRNE